MRRTYKTLLTPAECQTRLRACIDFVSLNFGQERYTGWVKFGIFHISYKDGEYSFQKYIFNKVIGKITSKQGQTIVKFKSYKGLTDIISLFVIFTLSFLIFLLVETNLPIIYTLLFSALCCCLSSVISFLSTWLSETGRDNEIELIQFMERNLELVEI